MLSYNASTCFKSLHLDALRFYVYPCITKVAPLNELVPKFSTTPHTQKKLHYLKWKCAECFSKSSIHFDCTNKICQHLFKSKIVFCAQSTSAQSLLCIFEYLSKLFLNLGCNKNLAISKFNVIHSISNSFRLYYISTSNYNAVFVYQRVHFNVSFNTW